MSTKTRVIDEKTKKLLFASSPEFGIDRILAIAGGGEKSIDKFSDDALTDIKVINERLNTIGELVSSYDLRERLKAIASAFGVDYKEFFHKIQEFKANKGASGYSKGRAASELRELIGEIATRAGNLPVDLPSLSSSSTLESIASRYSKSMSSNDSTVRNFFEYMIELNERIKELEPKKDGKEQTRTRFSLFMMDDQEGISYSQLNELLNAQSLDRFRDVMGQLPELAMIVAPYVRMASLAREFGYSRPDVVEKEQNCLIIVNGKNDRMGRNKVIGNPTNLGDGVKVEVVEGVNSGGKTYDMKKALYIASLALSGSWVPAAYAKVSIRNRIIMREKGTGDDMSAMQRDCINVIEATPPSGEYWLIGLDEIFTSTERRGGEALVAGTIRAMLDQENSLMIMSSHYLGLQRWFAGDRRVAFNHFPFEQQQGENGKTEIVFPYKKQNGPMIEFKYAIAIAAASDFDAKVLDFARERLNKRSK